MSALAEIPLQIPASSAPRLVAGKGITRIALVGPDGVGKSTVIRLLRESLNRDLPWLAVQVRQWRPGLLPNLGELATGQRSTGEWQRPRRKPGRFQLLRVGYYFLDFLLGSWWRDRLRVPEATLIVYDRCALDMQVDPVRFALSSKRGTRLLWKIVPRPDLVILLEDEPYRILQRKQELEAQEMAEQQAEWRRLAERGLVNASIRVDGDAPEIAGRVRQLAMEALSRRHGIRRVSGTDGVSWLRRLLPNAAYAAGREFIALPSRAHARLLIPPSPRRAAANGLAVYNPQRFLPRLAARMLRGALRAGLAQPFLRSRAHLPTQPLEDRLRDVTGESDAVVSVSLGTPGPRRKPTLQVIGANGDVFGYAKLGHDSVTAELLRNEADTLRLLAGCSFSTAIVPRVLDLSTCGGCHLLVQRARKSAGVPAPRLDRRHLRFLVELAGVEQPTTVPPVQARLESSAGSIRDAGFVWYASLIDRAADSASMALTETPVVLTHGDFAPWNIRESDSRLLVYDWEDAGPGLPASDIFYFLAAVAIELRGHDGARVFRTVSSADAQHLVACYLAAAGVSQAPFFPLLAAWSAEALSRNVMLHGHDIADVDLAWRGALASILFLALNRAGERP